MLHISVKNLRLESSCSDCHPHSVLTLPLHLRLCQEPFGAICWQVLWFYVQTFPSSMSTLQTWSFQAWPGSLAVTHPNASFLSWSLFFSVPSRTRTWILRLSPKDFGQVDLSVRYFESGLIYLGLQSLNHNPEIPKVLKSEAFYIVHMEEKPALNWWEAIYGLIQLAQPA